VLASSIYITAITITHYNRTLYYIIIVYYIHYYYKEWRKNEPFYTESYTAPYITQGSAATYLMCGEVCGINLKNLQQVSS